MGKGTKGDPFDGSTEAKLDAILAACGTNEILHFGPGTFLKRGVINGGAQIKAGQHWIGAGRGRTTIKLSSMWHPARAFVDYALGNGSDQDAVGATIEHMTVDCNAERFLTILRTNAVKADAIQLHASRNLTVRIFESLTITEMRRLGRRASRCPWAVSLSGATIHGAKMSSLMM